MKLAILHQTSRAKHPISTKQTQMEPYCEDPLPRSYKKVVNTEVMHADDLKDIPELLNTCIKPTLHPSNLHMSSVALSTAQTHIEVLKLYPLATSVQAMSPNTIPIRLKRTCSTPRPTPSLRYQATTLAGSSLLTEAVWKRGLWPPPIYPSSLQILPVDSMESKLSFQDGEQC